jgi:hypothetical protein
MAQYAVFLTSAAKDYAYAAGIIEELVGRYGAAPFAPHVTLHSGDFSHPQALQEAIAAALSGVGSLTLKLSGVGGGIPAMPVCGAGGAPTASWRALSEPIGCRRGFGI